MKHNSRFPWVQPSYLARPYMQRNSSNQPPDTFKLLSENCLTQATTN